MPEVERKMKLRRDVLWESGELKGNKGEKKSTTRKRGELFIRVKWLSVRAIYLLPRRWQEWAGVRYHSSAEVERQIYLSSVTAIRPPISPSVWVASVHLSDCTRRGRGREARGSRVMSISQERKDARCGKTQADGWLNSSANRAWEEGHSEKRL